MTDTATTPQAADDGDDISALVADVFGLPSDEPAPEPVSREAVNEPSVGTEGAGGGEPSGEPSPAFTPPDAGTGSAPAAPQPTPAAQPTATPAPTQEPDTRDLQIQSLTAQLAELKDLVTKKTETPTPDAGQQDQQQAPAAPKPINVQLPDALTGAIFGDDPAQAAQGLNALVSGIATSLTHAFEQKLAALEQKLATQVAGVGQQSEEETLKAAAESQRKDYFDAFPDHNKPVLMPIIAQLSRELAAELPGVEWNDNFRNTLGARVNQKLQELGVSSAQPQPAAQPTPAAPAAFLPQGARPERESEDDNIIMATLGEI